MYSPGCFSLEEGGHLIGEIEVCVEIWKRSLHSLVQFHVDFITDSP